MPTSPRLRRWAAWSLLAVGAFFLIVALLAAFGPRTDTGARGPGSLAIGAIGLTQLAAGTLVLRDARRSEWLAFASAVAGAALGVLVILFGERGAFVAWAVISVVLVAHTVFIAWALLREPA